MTRDISTFMKRLHALRQEVEVTDFPWTPVVLRVLDHFEKAGPGTEQGREHASAGHGYPGHGHGEITRIMGLPLDDTRTISALTVLTTWPDAILSPRLYLENGIDPILLPPDIGTMALTGRPFPHPITGEMITDPQDRTILIYEPRLG